MATLRDIQRRIRAVKSTRQITRAMKMVSAAKLRRAQGRMLELRPYADKMQSVIEGLAARTKEEAHPLLAVRPRHNVEVLVITSDRGLCGAFNTNILRSASALMAELGKEEVNSVSGGPVDAGVSVVGKKARDYYRRRRIEVSNTWVGLSGKISFREAQQIAAGMTSRFIEGDLDEVYMVYNEFVNVIRQQVRAVKLLPMAAGEEAAGVAEAGPAAGYIYEPSEELLLDALLPKNVEVQVYRALLESQASEEAARMSAMENATKSANEMIEKLTLQYNKARQATITAELMDIVGGVEALKAS
ncbi:MAG: ATP synthase F1 subunit gamma [Nitrospirota bacterium]